MIPGQLQPLANHLFQSTVFAGAAGLLTVALRKNRAEVRSWIWFGASLKFLIPFAVLVEFGKHLGQRTMGAAITDPPRVSMMLRQVGKPFAPPMDYSPLSYAGIAPLEHPFWHSLARLAPAITCAVWALGFAILVCLWGIRWLRVRAALRAASPLPLDLGIPVVTSRQFGAPGVFGIRRPVMLLPDGILKRLTPPQLEAIVAHELCHVRRRDILATAIHMTVEAVFWFYPPVWWLGARLIEERERACDEEVLRTGYSPLVYAEGILRVCELYLESPLRCVAGVTGGNLKRRIETIMSNRAVSGLSVVKKGLLAAAGMIALAAPIAIGMMNPPMIFAQATSESAQSVFTAADVHVSTDGSQSMRGGFYRGGRYEIRTASMVDLIRTAYGVDEDKVTGGPAWLVKDRFDVIAKAPADSTPESLKLMLQALLADRFQLVVHNDRKPVPAYVLTVGKKVLMKPADGSGGTGCKLQPRAAPPPGGPRVMLDGVALTIGPGSFLVYACHNVSMTAFPDELLNMVLSRQYLTLDRILDETELKGTWNFDFKYSPKLPAAMAAGDDSDILTLFEAVDKQLGLKLELTKVPMPVIAVDSVNEMPTENLPGVTGKMPAVPTEFEVVDIRPTSANPIALATFGFQRGGRVNLRNQAMLDLISLAWNMNGNPADRVIGLPKTMDTTRWDIVAKASPSAPLNAPPNGQPAAQNVDPDAMRIMLRALLRARFHLALHEEQRPLPGYALVAVKPKLEAADPSNRPGCKAGLFTCLNVTMAEFAQQIPLNAGGYFGQFQGGVVDATKLDGKYDVTLSFSGGITLQEAIEKQLGLKLEPRRNPATVLVIDHVDEKPTDN